MRSGLRESLSSAAAEAAAMASSAAGIGGGFLMERQTGHGMESWDCADCLFSDCHVMSCHVMVGYDIGENSSTKWSCHGISCGKT
jgi:hypothetical protein